MTIFSDFFPRYLQTGAVISHNCGDIFPIFSAFLSITVGQHLTIAGYFTSETIMAVSERNTTIFFIQSQETIETQHIYFNNTRVSHHGKRDKLSIIIFQATANVACNDKNTIMSVPLLQFTDVIG